MNEQYAVHAVLAHLCKELVAEGGYEGDKINKNNDINVFESMLVQEKIQASESRPFMLVFNPINIHILTAGRVKFSEDISKFWLTRSDSDTQQKICANAQAYD